MAEPEKEKLITSEPKPEETTPHEGPFPAAILDEREVEINPNEPLPIEVEAPVEEVPAAKEEISAEEETPAEEGLPPKIPDPPLPSLRRTDGGPAFRFNSAYSEGLRHIKEGVPCQDAVATYAQSVAGATTYAIALSDGCSSSCLAHYGSALTVNAIVETLTAEFDRLKMMPDRLLIPTLIERIIDVQKRFIEEHLDYFEQVKRKQGDFDAFASRYASRMMENPACDLTTLYYLRLMNATVLFVAERLGQTLYGHLGDGYILRLSEDNQMSIASMEDKTEEHNVTNYPQSLYFRRVLTGSDSCYRLMKIGRMKEPSSAWILISDGPENTLVEKKGPALTVRPYVFKLMVRCTMLEDTPEQARDVLQNFFDGKLRDSTAVHGGDDISTAIMVAESAYQTCADPDAHPIEYVTTHLILPAEEEPVAPVSLAPARRARRSKEEMAALKQDVFNLFLTERRLNAAEVMENLTSDRENPLSPPEIDSIFSELLAEKKIRLLESADESSDPPAFEVLSPEVGDDEE